MSDKKKPYEKPELTQVQPSEVMGHLLRGQQAMIDSVSAIGSLIQSQAKEIKALQDRVAKLEQGDDPVH